MNVADWIYLALLLAAAYYFAQMFIPSDAHCLKCGRRQTRWARDTCGGLCGRCFWEAP